MEQSNHKNEGAGKKCWQTKGPDSSQKVPRSGTKVAKLTIGLATGLKMGLIENEVIVTNFSGVKSLIRSPKTTTFKPKKNFQKLIIMKKFGSEVYQTSCPRAAEHPMSSISPANSLQKRWDGQLYTVRVSVSTFQ